MKKVEDILANPLPYFAEESRDLAHLTGVKVSGGIPEDLEPVGETAYLAQLVYVAQTRHQKTWRGLDVRHLPAMDTEREWEWYPQLDILAMLQPAWGWLSQESLDFITLRDVKNAQGNNMIRPASLDQYFSMNPDDVEVMRAFQNQMLRQAAEHDYQRAVGAYVLSRPDLPRLNNLIEYDQLRLIITRAGLVVSIVGGNMFTPFVWMPDSTNTAQIALPLEAVVLLDVMLSCIWRDASVVVKRWREQTPDKRVGKRHAYNPRRNDKLYFPRTVTVYEWGEATERHQIAERITRHAHVVRGSYPRRMSFTPSAPRMIAEGSQPKSD